MIVSMFFIAPAPTVAIAAPDQTAPTGDLSTCQAQDSAVSIPSCTAIIDNAGSADASKATAYALRAQAFTVKAYDEDRKSAEDWRTCLTAELDLGLAACTRIIDTTSEQNDRRANALYQRSKLLIDKGRGADAMADFQRSLKGVSDRQPGSREHAVEDYTSAIKLDPANAKTLAARGQLYLALGTPASASEDFNKALALNAKEGMALLGRALMRDANGDPVGAVADLKTIIGLPTATDEAKWLNKTAAKIMSSIGAD